MGDRLSVHYRLSAADDGGFQTQPVAIADRQPSRITIVSGNGQEADWQEKLKAPLVVKVTNKAGEVLEGVPLKWTVQSESWGTIVGSLTETQPVTDDKGLAQTDYTVGMQQEQPEKVLVQVLDKDEQPIPGLETIFTYKPREYHYSLIILKPTYDTEEFEVVDEWTNGDDVMLYYGQNIIFKVALDGKVLNYPDGREMRLGANFENLHTGPKTQLANHPFQMENIVIKDCPIILHDPQRGFSDSIMVNLTINNELYRNVVGKTIKVIGSDQPAPPGYLENHNSGEVVTFQFRADGKLQIHSTQHPKYNGTFGYAAYAGAYGYAAIHNCDVNNTNPAIMKKVIGIIHADSEATSSYHNHGLTVNFILFEDYTITAYNAQLGYSPCDFNAYWKSLTLE